MARGLTLCVQAQSDSSFSLQAVAVERPGRQAALDLHEMKLSSRVLSAWAEVTREGRRRQYGLMMKAVVFQRRQTIVVIFRFSYQLFQDSTEEIFLHVDEVQFTEGLHREDCKEY